jgi:ribonuclease E
MRAKTSHEQHSQPKSENSGKRGKNQKKPEVAKVVTPERAIEINNVVAQIAASTLNSQENTSDQAATTQVKATSNTPETVLDSVLGALPEPAAPGQGRKKSRRVTTEMLSGENSSENAG